MKDKVYSLLCVVFSVVFLTSCEKLLLDEKNGAHTDANVIMKLSIYEDLPFDTRSMQPIAELCTRLNVAFFKDGTKVKTVIQKAEDEGFGTVEVSLEEGTYEAVIIAHNCTGSATISSTEKVTFPNNVVTDTFYYYGTVTAGASSSTYNLDLKRVVSMFRLNLTEPLPEDVTKIRFYYTGGSSTFNPLTGFGSVKSKQNVTLDVVKGQQVFEVYTLPHATTGTLDMTISLFNANDEVVKECALNQIPVTCNRVTQYTGDFKDGSTVSQNSFSLEADGDWEGTDTYVF